MHLKISLSGPTIQPFWTVYEIYGLAERYEALLHREQRVAQYDGMIERIAAEDERVQLLMTIPGVFRNGRECAAWLRLTPKQHSSGGKARLGKVSKMGQRDLRRSRTPVNLLWTSPGGQPVSCGAWDGQWAVTVPYG